METRENGAVEECLRRIGRLPHAAAIRPEDAIRWVRLTLSIDPERVHWHIARAGGVGGSEAGAMLSWAYGEGSAREGAERLARRKLLMLPPDAGNFDTMRGVYLEPFVRQVYEERMTRDGRDWRRRDDLRAHVEAGTHPEMPWMRASLDGLYEVDGVLTIPDFKAPSEDSLQGMIRHGDYDEYRAQLNHYALVARGRGVEIGALDLVLFDYRRVATEGARICPVEVDPDMQDRLGRASSRFWSCVAGGELPEAPRERVLAHPGIPPEIEDAARRALHAKVLMDGFGDAFEENRGKVTRWVSKAGRLNGGMLPLGSLAEGARGLLEVRGKPGLDVGAAVGRLADLGMDAAAMDGLRRPDSYDPKKLGASCAAMSALLRRAAEALPDDEAGLALAAEIEGVLKAAPLKERGAYDPDSVKEALASFGEIPDNFTVEAVSANLPRGNSQDLLEFKEVVGARGTELMEDLVPCMQGEDKSQKSPEGPSPGR